MGSRPDSRHIEIRASILEFVLFVQADGMKGPESGEFVVPIFTVSVVFESSEGAWLVSRARTVVATYASCRDAIGGACEIAVAMRRRMHCGMRLRVRDMCGDWHMYSVIGGHCSAAAMASYMLNQLRSGVLEPPAVHSPRAPFVFYVRMKSFFERGAWMLMHRPVRA